MNVGNKVTDSSQPIKLNCNSIYVPSVYEALCNVINSDVIIARLLWQYNFVVSSELPH